MHDRVYLCRRHWSELSASVFQEDILERDARHEAVEIESFVLVGRFSVQGPQPLDSFGEKVVIGTGMGSRLDLRSVSLSGLLIRVKARVESSMVMPRLRPLPSSTNLSACISTVLASQSRFQSF